MGWGSSFGSPAQAPAGSRSPIPQAPAHPSTVSMAATSDSAAAAVEGCAGVVLLPLAAGAGAGAALVAPAAARSGGVQGPADTGSQSLSRPRCCRRGGQATSRDEAQTAASVKSKQKKANQHLHVWLTLLRASSGPPTQPGGRPGPQSGPLPPGRHPAAPPLHRPAPCCSSAAAAVQQAVHRAAAEVH